jgi:ubiquinone/menaquinone biosynthesis C-methylase UbiE
MARVIGDGAEMTGVEQIPPVYDGVVGPLNRFLIGKWRRELAAPLHGAVVEIGVGTGLNLSYYGAEAHVTGIEPERALIAAARARAAQRGYRLSVGDAQELPFADASFDAAVSTLVFCSLSDPARALDELRRVLRPHAKLYQLEHTRTGRPRIDALLDRLAPTWHRISGGCNINRDVAAILHTNGWHIERHDRHAGGLLRLLISSPPR